MKSEGEERVLSEFEQEVVRKLNEVLEILTRLEASRISADDEHGNPEFPNLISGSPSRGKVTRGRRSKLALDQLLDRRNLLVEILEQYCPEIMASLLKATSPNQAGEALANSVSAWTGPRPPILVDTHSHAEQLWSFLKSDRFHNNLRNLASAMAGVPEMSWKRSFDLCVKNPPKQRISVHHRAIRDFLHRNFPERLRELESAKDTTEVRKILAKSRSKDTDYLKLKANPGWVLEWIRNGIVK